MFARSLAELRQRALDAKSPHGAPEVGPKKAAATHPGRGLCACTTVPIAAVLTHIRNACYIMHMGNTLHISNVGDELIRALKIDAIRRVVTMRELVLQTLEGLNGNDEGRAEGVG